MVPPEPVPDVPPETAIKPNATINITLSAANTECFAEPCS